MSTWTVLRNFDSEVEGRVVESFLRARGFEVQLLDTYSPAYRFSPSKSGGLRLMIRSTDAEAIDEILSESQKGAHLQIVNEGDAPPIRSSASERWILSLFLVVAVLIYILAKLA